MKPTAAQRRSATPRTASARAEKAMRPSRAERLVDLSFDAADDGDSFDEHALGGVGALAGRPGGYGRAGGDEFSPHWG